VYCSFDIIVKNSDWMFKVKFEGWMRKCFNRLSFNST